MTTQQVVALLVICLFIIGLFAYAYFLGKKASRAHHPTGLLFDSPPCAGHSRPTSVSLQISASEGSGHDMAQAIREAIPASLREASSIDAQKTKSLCCEAAGIIHPLSSSAEALIPHDKLREAAPVDATLIAKNRPHAQPAEGYTHPSAISCIVAAMDATLAEQAGTYASSEQMAQAIEAALQQAGLLISTDHYLALRSRLDELLVNRQAEQRKHHHTVAALKREITALEGAIAPYMNMPASRAEYDLLLEAAKTLRLAEQTMKALKSDQPAKRAAQQAKSLEAVAKRIHAQLRSNPRSVTQSEDAA
ncbi:hypothetical protein ACTORG_13295 [Pseudomonas guariconensis]|uniref:hypothetical protein n=1 Tax=Pseudomonas guariconensis TaxID=1288410 RepID=UPI003F90148E